MFAMLQDALTSTSLLELVVEAVSGGTALLLLGLGLSAAGYSSAHRAEPGSGELDGHGEQAGDPLSWMSLTRVAPASGKRRTYELDRLAMQLPTPFPATERWARRTAFSNRRLSD